VNKNKKMQNPLEFIDSIGLTVRMFYEYIYGEYDIFPWRTLAGIGLSVCYFIMPFDIIPDFFLGLGWLDDIGAVALGFLLIRYDLRNFRRWFEWRKNIVDVEYEIV